MIYKAHIKNCITVFLLLFFCGDIKSQITPEWVDTSATPLTIYDSYTTSKVQVDANGNQYFADMMYDTSYAAIGLKVVKYNSSGIRLVDTIVNGYNANRIYTAFDGAGNFYVGLFHPLSSLKIYKFDNALNLVWLSNAPNTSGYVFAYNDVSMVFDRIGNLLLNGRGDTTTSSLYDHTITMKINPAGTLLWAKKYAGYIPGKSCIGTDSLLNVYVATRSAGFTTGQINLIKYHGTGLFLWDTLLNVAGNSDFPYLLKVTKKGVCYVFGIHEINSNTNFLLVKCNSNGGLMWSDALVSNTSGDEPIELVLDKYENVFASGTLNTNTGSGTSRMTFKYDSTGTRLWQRQFSTYPVPNLNEQVTCMAIDSMSNVFVSGYTYTPSGNALSSTIKYNTYGDTLWLHTFSYNGSNRVFFNSSGCDAAGNYYIAGNIEFYNLAVPYTGLLFLKYGFSTGINELTDATHLFSVYPNPCNNFLRIYASKMIKEDVIIYNYAGQIMKKVSKGNLANENTEINTSDLKRGLYFISYAGSVQKFVKE